jgi:hypothetical protein
VLTFVKGGRIQLNVLRGEDSQGCAYEGTQEMCIFEVQEMVFESIPGSVLQTYVLINNKERAWAQVLSLFASAIAVGVISSRMSYYMVSN